MKLIVINEDKVSNLNSKERCEFIDNRKKDAGFDLNKRHREFHEKVEFNDQIGWIIIFIEEDDA